MPIISENILLSQLKQADNAAFAQVYATIYPSIQTYILQNAGSTEDAEDVFQETMLVLLANIKKSNFVLTSSLKTYVFAIAKNTWLKKQRTKKNIALNEINGSAYVDETKDFELINVPSKEDKLFHWLSKITANCQLILKSIFFYKQPMSSLMQKMGWKNKHTAANQQYKCLQQIKKQKEKE